MAEIDLNFISRQLDRLIGDWAAMRDELRVLSAIVMRLDGGQNAMLVEMYAIRDQITRMNERVRKLEDQP
jgi:hypothetical protein